MQHAPGVVRQCDLGHRVGLDSPDRAAPALLPLFLPALGARGLVACDVFGGQAVRTVPWQLIATGEEFSQILLPLGSVATATGVPGGGDAWGSRARLVATTLGGGVDQCGSAVDLRLVAEDAHCL